MHDRYRVHQYIYHNPASLVSSGPCLEPNLSLLSPVEEPALAATHPDQASGIKSSEHSVKKEAGLSIAFHLVTIDKGLCSAQRQENMLTQHDALNVSQDEGFSEFTWQSKFQTSKHSRSASVISSFLQICFSENWQTSKNCQQMLQGKLRHYSLSLLSQCSFAHKASVACWHCCTREGRESTPPGLRRLISHAIKLKRLL